MKLGLGTVQFGLDYGIANKAGKVSGDEVRKIFARAKQAGIRLLDTSPAYGNSEEVIGHKDTNSTFEVVTKTLSLKTAQLSELQALMVKKQFITSLESLKRSKVYGLLAHHADDLLVYGGELLYAQMLELKNAGLVEKIGASIYRREQIERLVERYEIDILQVPVNVLDQRLMSDGYLGQLRSEGIEIHSRSVFLQGLLLMAPETCNSFFDPVKEQLIMYRKWLFKEGLNPVSAALNFIKNLDDIDYCIVGVDSLAQLNQIIAEYNKGYVDMSDYAPFACQIENILTPSMWPN